MNVVPSCSRSESFRDLPARDRKVSRGYVIYQFLMARKTPRQIYLWRLDRKLRATWDIGLHILHHTHTHKHTYTELYIYIYIYNQGEIVYILHVCSSSKSTPVSDVR